MEMTTTAYDLPATRPYLTRAQSPREFVSAYILATWGSMFGQQDMVDAVLRRTRRGTRTRGEQKAAMLAWMDFMDASLAAHAATGGE